MEESYQSMLFRKYLASPLTEFLAIIVVASILIVGSLFVFNGKLLASNLSSLSPPLLYRRPSKEPFFCIL